MGVVNKFGSNAGALVTTTIITPVNIGTGNEAQITDFCATAVAAAANTTLTIQRSNDNFAVNIVTLDQIEMPNGGTVVKTYDSPLLIKTGERFRVQFIQTAAGAVTAAVLGQTTIQDVRD